MIYLAADHRGFLRKEEVKNYLVENNIEFVDSGNIEMDPNDDASVFAIHALEKMTDADRGIFFCGSGVMMDIVANRFAKIRSCLGINSEHVKSARNDDDVNVLCVATDFIANNDVISLVVSFLDTPFSFENRYTSRIEKVKNVGNFKIQ